MYLTAREAAAELGVSLATLYAYVSRGLVRSEESPDDPRARRYLAEDVNGLKHRKAVRRNPEVATQGALSWGDPILESAISLVENGRLYYRGIDAVELAANRSLEEVASWIWLDRFDADLFATVSALPVGPATDRPGLAFQLLLPRLAEADTAAFDPRPESVARTGAVILSALVAATAGNEPAPSLAGRLQRAWTPGRDSAARSIEQALILCADHELNVSTFTARCVASAGATPYDVILAGLAALRGVKHGGQTERSEAFLRDLAGRPNPAGRIAEMSRWGESIPGFGHPLYPQGDPRAIAILGSLDRLGVSHLARSIAAEVERLTGQRANLDFALGALAQALSLPPGSGFVVFALGRVIGWIGHAIEQYASGQLIRPRARYNGRVKSEE